MEPCKCAFLVLDFKHNLDGAVRCIDEKYKLLAHDYLETLEENLNEIEAFCQLKVPKAREKIEAAKRHLERRRFEDAKSDLSDASAMLYYEIKKCAEPV